MFDRTKLKRSITNDRKNATDTKPISRFATLTPGENIKEKQQKLKEERESKRKQLDDRHWYILQTVADCLQLDKLDVEESILEGTQIEIIHRFLEANGARQLIFYYQEPTVEKTTDNLRLGVPLNRVNRPTKAKIFVTDGKELCLRGTGLLFIKVNTCNDLTEANIAKEVNYMQLHASGSSESSNTVLTSLEALLSNIFIPAACNHQNGWGELDTQQQGQKIQNNFYNSMSSFVSVLSGAQDSLGEKVTLQHFKPMSSLQTFTASGYVAIANSGEALEEIENIIKIWIKQVEQVLAESEQMRREADDIGPRAELEHWKRRMSKFNYLLDQIKGEEVRTVLCILQVAKSKFLKIWQELDRKITDAANEARDNVKFLYTLEKFCDPLYNSNPVGMLAGIAGLINGIRMIHSISRYYNTSERMTSLFVKVTNQMITASKAYITCDGSETVWTQPTDLLMKKLHDCIMLNDTYQKCFQQTKEKLEKLPHERQFDFSGMYIFGKFDTFVRRLRKIIEMFETIELYSNLSTSKIEGLESMSKTFQSIVSCLRNKTYNCLDQRKTEYDQDFEDFKRKIQELHMSVADFMEKRFESHNSSQLALQMLQKFELLKLPNLGIQEKYQQILLHYVKDIEMVTRLYQKYKNNPPVTRDYPLFAGKMSWARQLFSHLQEPMEDFKQHSAILQCEESKAIIVKYNRMTKVLLEFEILYYREWLHQVESVKEKLQSPLLVRHPKTKELFVNFDSKVMMMIRETECMARLGYIIPPFACILRSRQEEYKKICNGLELMLKENNNIRSKFPSVLEPLMQVHIARVDKAIEPGLTTLTWTAIGINEYLENVEHALKLFTLLLDRVTDICEFRIEANLLDISQVKLCELPEVEPWSVKYFMEKTQFLCAQGAQSLSHKSQNLENAVNELITVLCDKPQEEEYGEESTNTEKSQKYAEGAKKNSRPFFRTDAILTIPSITVQPALDEIQQVINKAVHMIVGVHKHVAHWSKQSPKFLKVKVKSGTNIVGPFSTTSATEAAAISSVSFPMESQERLTSLSINDLSESVHSDPFTKSSHSRVDPDNSTEISSVQLLSKSYYKCISENKEIAKLVSLLSASINSTKKEVANSLKEFSHYHILWDVDRNKSLERFLQEDPSLSDFESNIIYYEQLENKIHQEPEYFDVGSIAIYTEKLRFGLLTETKTWRQHYGKACNIKYRTDMEENFTFIEDLNKRLNRPIIDLDDVRHAMAALKEIRENEIKIEMSIGPIEESYAMLNRHKLPVRREETDPCDTLRYSWEKLQAQASEVGSHLLTIQPEFRHELITNVNIFHNNCTEFYEEYAKSGPMVAGIDPRDAADRLIIFQNHFDNLYRKYITYTRGEELFGLPVTQCPELMQINKELKLLQKLYGLYTNVIDTVTGYQDIPWSDVNIEKINAELLELQNRCRKLPRALKDWQAFKDLKQKIDDFNEIIPLLQLMSNQAMKDRHWKRLTRVTGYQFEMKDDNLLLKNVLEAPLLKYKEEIEDICISAEKEKDIEAKLKQVMLDWDMKEFTFGNFKNRGEQLLRGDATSEIVGLIEDSLMILSSLMNNRFNAPFKREIQQWVQNLSNSSEIIDNWLTVQNLWVYLEAVFVGGDIAKQLPKEAKRFSNIDKSWVKIMSRAHEIPNVVRCCVGDDTLIQLLPHLLEQLELCQKSLTGYLEKKRLLFPRFFFVSDPALLEILGQASDCHTIQAHLLSVFDNIKLVKFHEKQYETILSVESSEGECMELDKPVKAEGNVEVWLMSLMKMAQKSLHGIIRKAANAIQESNFKLLEFLNSFPAQVGILGIQLLWTRDATIALTDARSDRKRKPMQQANQSFLKLLNTLITQTTADLNKMDRTKYETLITIHVHQRDIFDELCHTNVRSPTDFEWLKQSRFYFIEDQDKCMISITNVNFTYQNEFLGCTERLVITPLTDRCYITLAQALGMSMGGAPAGPAGTGKTETTKDMGRCLGKYVVVFNCSDQMDFRGLGRIYKGLAQSGTWGCFDEFNRIDLPVLSVAAQQIAIVLTCKKERKNQFVFTDGDVIQMNPEFGIFLTMNPGYAGRQELPENLKINFRTVAMMVPDRQIIIRVKLASAGFINNINLACKFFTLYKLCEEQLTKQVHYDFGLRNILSVLRTLGAKKRASPEETEHTIVMSVLRDMNLSKLVDQDEPLFLSLINDLFPGIILSKQKYAMLEDAIDKHINENCLVQHPSWILKVIQLYETQLVRHGMMTLGPSGSGKTCCIHTLMKAMTECGKVHKEMRMNPKAITSAQMFGKLDVATNDWTDGIFSTLWRRTLKAKKGEHIWIVLDGPVDAIWIENLNSVLDDNRTLTLANGDRIPMAPNTKIIFEPHNIDNASPATVSRNGMVYMSSSGLNWKPILQGWLNHRPLQEAMIIMNLFEESFPIVFNYSIQNFVFKMDILEVFIISQATKLLSGLIPAKDEKDPQIKEHYAHLYIFTLLWSIGAFLELDDRAKLEQFLRTTPNVSSYLPKIDESSESTIFDYMVAADGSWVHWNNLVKEYHYPKHETPEYASILVPMVDNVRTDYLLNTIAKQGKAVMLIGEQGTAKTVMINAYLRKYNPENHVTKALNFSSATTPLMFQKSIESYVDKRVGNTYGPTAGKKMSVFIDDINMPVVNEWGDQVANEIVRQLIEMNGYYSLEKPGDFINITDIQFLASMIHPGGGRNDIPQRLKRHFAIFNCTLPSNTSIDKIFSTIGLGHYCKERGFAADIIEMVQKLIPLTRRLWQLTKVKMLPTPAKFHYIFNLRDLSRIWQGMINVESSVINSTTLLLGLWKHECSRVISDRFVLPADIKWYEKTTERVVLEDLGQEYREQIQKTLYFTDFLRDPPEPSGEEPDDEDFEMPKVYEPIESFDQLQEWLQNYLEQYNETIRGIGMDLVFFEDAMIHLMKISRIIRTARGNALLVGVGGSGKQSLTRLASYIAGYQIFQITLSRSYNVINLLEDLKHLYRVAGLYGKGITFLFTDQEIKDEGFLEYLNNVLSSGLVANLFARDEMDEILGDLTPIMKKEMPRRPSTNENLYEYYLSRVRSNLHVVLCFSPVDEQFRLRSLKFPGLISGCTIDWFQRWPKDALVAVANHFISNFDIACTVEVKRELVYAMGSLQHGVSECCTEYFHRYRRSTHVTPKSYLSFINGYKTIYTEKRKELGEMVERMNTGLEKLIEASLTVVDLKKQLVVKEKELTVATEKAEMVLKEVTEKAKATEQSKDKVQKVKDIAQQIVDSIATDKNIAMEKLEAARPALEEAEAALNTIRPADIATVRKLGRPPHLIMRIMDCVLILFRKKLDPVVTDAEKPGFLKPSWGETLKLMSGAGMLQSLMSFPKDSINDEMVELLQPYLKMEDYNLEVAKKVCGNVAGLLSWTKAMAYFFEINKEVLPLKDNLAVQEAKLQSANADLMKAEDQLSVQVAKLNAVKIDYDRAMVEKQTLVDDYDSCKSKMTAASELISGLAGEKERWTEQSKEFNEQIGRLVGDVLICTAFLSYAGPFNQDFRLILHNKWIKELKTRKIPHTANLNVTDMLTNPTLIGEWNLQGLPNDELSIQNGIIVTKAVRYPLLIDPQGQGKKWIKQQQGDKDLQVTSLNHKYFRQHLEDCMSLGRPLLIDDIGEELDPALDNILEKNFIKIGTSCKVKVGDKECNVMNGFTLYITTKLPNPSYTPEISARTSIIDFTVTVKGLEDQLLGRVILMEKAELESERVKLMEDITTNKKKMQELEDNLLYRLTSTQGSLVEDSNLINVLHITKDTSQEVKQKLITAAETEVKINEAREEFRPVATRGSILYFLITEMSLVNCMYQTALEQFLQLFDMSMERSAKSPITQKRILNIIRFMTYEIYKYTVRSLYATDKLTFTLLLTLKIDLQAQKIRHEEFLTFIKGDYFQNHFRLIVEGTLVLPWQRYSSNTAQSILDTILNIQPKDSSGGSGETRESIVYNISNDMLESLPADYVMFDVKAQLEKVGALEPMNIFLRQEIDRMQRVITAVRNTLLDLKLAIDGAIIMNEHLRHALDAMFNARIPSYWQKISWESSNLGFWFTELSDRNAQFRSWCFEGRPAAFWMTGFFNPQGFLTAMRQEVTRKYKHKGWALDSVYLQNDVTTKRKEETLTIPSEGVYIYGLYLEGAGWDRSNSRLQEAKPKILSEPIPVIHMYAVNQPRPVDSKTYVCPIYKKPCRTDLTYVASVTLKVENNTADKWVKRGVALLCDIK
ncbi:dynein axonemal heavy chain 5-like [Octopus bimaculoides]|nr:dynein axonemal heavy chain 5-like [Octopus bimaculoides]